MTPMQATRLSLGESLAANTVLFPVATPPEAILFKNNVALTEDLVVADLDLADFDGYAPIPSDAPPFSAAIDPVSGDQIVTIDEPAGGWRWETSGVTNLPQTIYGFGLTNGAGTVLHAAALLDDPVTLTAAGQEINLGSLTFRGVPVPMS